MRRYAKQIISLSMVVMMLAMIFSFSVNTTVQAAPSSNFITTTSTRYDSADDVQYKTYSVSGRKVISNWGARGEKSVFLTTYAEAYYKGEYVWDTLSEVDGGSTQTNANSSDLYSKLQALMKSNHTFYTYYNGSKNVRDFYKYTDCVSNNINQVSLLYRGGLVSSAWDSGSTWNQEHVWPQSKLSDDKQIGDIMHLRPANPSENSSRGNTAYGKSKGYYDPGSSVRGDCARMVLYMYVRWGTTGTMWGSSGVIENLTVLLEWMEEDPVDTWEMGRNDAVQSITGARNVFVDYPEYAWLLFGKEVPDDMTTPSGKAKNMGSNQGGNQGGNNDSGNQGGNTDGGNTDTGNGNDSTNNDGGNNDSTGNDNNNNDSTGNDNNTNNDNDVNNDSGSEENGSQGGVSNNNNNGSGAQWDPNSLKPQQVMVDDAGFELDTWVIVAIVAGAVLVAGAVVATTVVLIKKKK